MKHDVFNQYVERVSDLFGVSKDDIFSKSKKREFVDARHLVYYLCAKRPMQVTYIQKYMNEAGYQIKHSSITIKKKLIMMEILNLFNIFRKMLKKIRN